jgi:hypothetical protein
MFGGGQEPEFVSIPVQWLQQTKVALRQGGVFDCARPADFTRPFGT